MVLGSGIGGLPAKAAIGNAQMATMVIVVKLIAFIVAPFNLFLGTLLLCFSEKTLSALSFRIYTLLGHSLVILGRSGEMTR